MTPSKEKTGLDNPSFEDDRGRNLEISKSYVEKNDKSETDNDVQNGDANIDINGNDDQSRAQWGNGLQFLMSCIAMSVGLGNIWRFPFTAYENGGGAFLIPYIIILIVIGRPLYYMEMALGQFSSRGSIKMYESIMPALKGVGYGQIMGTACVATYYCSLMAITMFYLINSFTADLPWADCRSEWEAENLLKNQTCIPSKESANVTGSGNEVSSSELYFIREVLKEATQIDDGIGEPEWRLTLCLLGSWILTFLVSRSGVKSSGKFSYFLALFPYVVMIALLIRASTLKGAGEGILYFIRPQWEKLAEADVWYNAVTQCFFSLSVSFGPIVMYSSYNNFDQNINRDALIVTSLDTFTSLLAGTTIFGILGNLAYELGVEVEDVINSGGTGLAFISYPEAIAKFDSVPWLFAILFFFMLFVLGVGSLVGLQSCVNTVIKDSFPSLKSWWISGGTAAAGFLIGLIYVTPGGQFMLNLVDHFGGTFIIYMLAIAEICGIMWCYGVENFCDDLEFMLKMKVGVYWRITWGIVTPTFLIVIFLYFLITMERLTYGVYEYPDKAIVCGWLILAAAILMVLFYVFKYAYDNKKLGFPKMIAEAFTNSNWGPKNKNVYKEWKEFKERKAAKRSAEGRSWLSNKLRFFIGR